MTHLRILFETCLNQRSALFCVDRESNFLTLVAGDNEPMGSFMTRDFLFGIGYANSLLMDGLSLHEITEFANSLKKMKTVDTLIEANTGAARLVLCHKNQTLFEKVFSHLVDAEMMGESYIDALQGWKITRKKNSVTRAALEPILVRRNETHHGQICRIRYGTTGSGVLLRVWEGDKLILESLGLFAQAVGRGNTLIPHKPPRGVIRLSPSLTPLFGAPLILENHKTRVLEDLDDESDIRYTLNKVETRVTTFKQASSPGFRVTVRIDGEPVASLVRDHDEGGLVYTLPQAIKRAQSLLTCLQGWELAENGNIFRSNS